MKQIVAVVFITVACVSSQLGAGAQDALLPATTQALTGITVTGHAEVVTKPDVAYASLGVQVQDPNQADAVADNATKATAVKQALIKAGVAETDIKTDSYQVSPQYDYHTSPGVLVGYQVTNLFKVTIHNLPKAGLIVDKATTAGANQVNGVTYDLIDRDAVEGQALAAAVANARSKADLMAGAAGVTLGRLVDLSENANQQGFRPMPMMMAAVRSEQATPTTPLQQSDIVVDADVTALYAIGYGK